MSKWKVKLRQGELFLCTDDESTIIAQVMGYGSPEGKQNAILLAAAPETKAKLHELQITNAKLGVMYVQEVPDLEAKVDELLGVLERVQNHPDVNLGGEIRGEVIRAIANAKG